MTMQIICSLFTDPTHYSSLEHMRKASLKAEEHDPLEKIAHTAQGLIVKFREKSGFRVLKTQKI